MVLRVCIIGTGDHAYGLCHLFKVNNSESSNNFLEVTKPGLEKGGFFHDTGVPLVAMEDGIFRADVVVLSIPAKSLKSFVADHIRVLKDKIIVDPTNSSVAGEDLHSLFSVTNVRWVKAFNDIGAVDVLLNKPYSKNKVPAKMCSRYPEVVDIVKAFGEESLGMDVKVVPYERFLDIAQHQNTLGTEWMQSTYILLVVFALSEFYALLR